MDPDEFAQELEQVEREAYETGVDDGYSAGKEDGLMEASEQSGSQPTSEETNHQTELHRTNGGGSGALATLFGWLVWLGLLAAGAVVFVVAYGSGENEELSGMGSTGLERDILAVMIL